MKTEIEAAIKVLLAKVTKDSKSHEDLQYTQAALNLAHVSQVLEQAKAKQQ